MNLHKYLKIKSAETEIDLKTAADMMGVVYKSFHARLLSGKLPIEELLQLSDIYGFTIEEMKDKIEYKKVNPNIIDKS